ncbi:MAG: glycosyltransferase family 4 protein [bacterium]|nr:glycosyltransferase family 4 protein [bacterium]
MKIFFITSKLNFISSGGSIEEIDLIIRTLQKKGNDVTVVTAHSVGNDIPSALPYKVIEENIGASSYVALQKNIIKLIKKYSDQTDIFHIDAHLFVYGAGLYKLLGGKTPVVAFFNQYLSCWPQYESSLFPQPIVPFLKKIKSKIRFYIEKNIGMFLANKVDLFTFVSPTLRKMYEDFGIRKSTRDLVIGDPIDIKKIMSDGKVGEESYSSRVTEKKPIILFYSSRMSAGKGFDILIKAFSCLADKSKYKLILGGIGPEEKYVKNMVAELGLQDFVEIPGWVSKEQLYENYRNADIFIQADWWPAGTSISLIYALAFGVPSILPGGGGLQWNAGEGALYFKYRDYKELAQTIEKLGGDLELRKELSIKCYDRLHHDEMNPDIQIGKLDEGIHLLMKKFI